MGPESVPPTMRNWWAQPLKPYRDKVVIATKFGIHFDWSSKAVNLPGNGFPTGNHPCFGGGFLKRLQTDHIDLYYQHRLDPQIPIEEVAGVMSELIQEGKNHPLGPV